MMLLLMLIAGLATHAGDDCSARAFDPKKIWQVEITLTRAEFRAIQPGPWIIPPPSERVATLAKEKSADTGPKEKPSSDHKQNVATKDAPGGKTSPAKDAAPKEELSKGGSSKVAPAKDAPAKDASAKDAPLKDGAAKPAVAEKKKPPARDFSRNAFGVNLPWAIGGVTINGTKFTDVGLRYKGNGTIGDSNNTNKKSFKIDLDRHGETGRAFGSKTINLHCGVTDPSKLRETFGYALFRRAGLPAPRTALAEVRLTVPGKFERELLGIYTIVESVDKGFLAENFGDDEGLLLKPEPEGFSSPHRDLSYHGEEWEKYQKDYDPRRPPTAEEAKRITSFFKLIHKASDADFRREIESYIDIEQYLRFLAMTALQANIDSFFNIHHNVYLYLHPKTNKIHFVPWDVDRSFANFPFMGTSAQHMDLSINKPYIAHRLTDRLLADAELKSRYLKIVKEQLATIFATEPLLKEVAEYEALVQPILEKELASAKARKEFVPSGPFAPPKPPTLQTFFKQRTESVNKQLAGNANGFVPKGLFGN